jgi:Glutaminase
MTMLQATCRIMSVVAATLANGGVCPLTNEEVFTSDTVKRVSCDARSDGSLWRQPFLAAAELQVTLGPAAWVLEALLHRILNTANEALKLLRTWLLLLRCCRT